MLEPTQWTLPLFAEPPQARRTDPATSHQAAASAKELQAQHHQVIVACLKRHGALGKDGIAARTGLTGVAVARRTRRLLDAYYLRESPLPADVMLTAKLIRLRSMAADVEAVLREFFQLTEDGWRHLRCDKEIEKMQDKQAKARDAAQQSVKARKANAERTLAKTPTDAERTLAKESTDVELPTPTPTPNTSSLRSEVGTRKRATSRPCDVEEQTWSDWLALRKAKRAPVTDTVVEEARKEAGLAGLTLHAFLRVWCVRGSQGLRADWLKPAELQAARPAASAESFRERDERLAREKMAAFLPGIAAKGPAAASRNVIDITPALLAIGE